MANYLKTDFWSGWDISHRNFNLSSTGLHAKNGTISYNTTGNIQDGDGLVPGRADLVDEAFKLFKAILGIDFQPTTSDQADINFADNESGAFTLAGIEGSTTNVVTINIASDWDQGSNAFDDYTFQTILHEIGHGLGLGHQGLYNASGTYSLDADFTNDSWQSSMMSYFSQSDNTSVEAGFAFLSTPMVVDWIALDQIYAAQGFGITNAFQGDTTYGFNTTISATTSRIFNQLAELIPFTAFTLVDGGGYDTLDFSRFFSNQLIDLRDSDKSASNVYSSNIAGNIGNLTITPGTIIEAAIGGSGNDTFRGNSANNKFNGGDGTDTLLVGGSPDDYSLSQSADSLILTDLRNTRPDGMDTLDNIEQVSFNGEILSFSDLINRLDGTPPTILITTDASSLGTSQTATVTFSLSENSFDFTPSDVSLSGGSLSDWTADSASSYSAIYTPTDKKNNNKKTTQSTISVASGTFSDAAGNFNIDGSDRDNSVSIQIKNDVPPSFAIRGKALLGRKLQPRQTGKKTNVNGPFKHVWQISSNGSSWTTVKKGNAYVSPAKHAGKSVRLLTTYIDHQGFSQETQSGSRTISRQPLDIGSASFGRKKLSSNRKINRSKELRMANNDRKGDAITDSKKNIVSHDLNSFSNSNAKYSETGFHPPAPELRSFKTSQSSIDLDILIDHNRSAQARNTGFAGESESSAALGPTPRVISSVPRVSPVCRNPEKDQITGFDEDNLIREMKTINAITPELI